MANIKTQSILRKTIYLGLALAAFGILPLTRISAQTNSNTNSNANTPVAVTDTTTTTTTDPVADLNAQIEAKKKRVAELEQQAALLQQNVESAASKVFDIKSQITAIDSQIAQTNFSIDAKQEEISTLELEMSSIQSDVDRKNEDITTKKAQLAEAIKKLDANSRVSTLALVLNNSSLSEFYSQAQATASISASLSDTLGTVTTLRDELQAKQDELVKTRDDYRQSKLQLEIQKQSTTDQKTLKDQLLNGAQQTKSQYQALLEESAREEQQSNATISSLEKQLRERLDNKNSNFDLPVFNSKGYVWPVAGKKVTAYFHDPTYPFKRIVGEHTGVDVGIPQGTPVRATADGVVSVVHDQGFYTDTSGKKIKSALNYVGLVHDKDMSSRYLHLSAVYVHTDQFVKQGEIIGLSGGLPGTAGAGGVTTGAHLHFEIRSGGLPDDPLKYLP